MYVVLQCVHIETQNLPPLYFIQNKLKHIGRLGIDDIGG